jgi:hypothetical protein
MICASGYRSSVAASLLRQAGFRDVAWVSDGVPAWRDAQLPLSFAEPADPLMVSLPPHAHGAAASPGSHR